MITFSNLGKFGRLGNQLFQISAVVSHSLKNGFNFGFPQWEYNKYLENNIPIFNGPYKNLGIYHEKDPWAYSDITRMDNIDLVGYFQNPAYFGDYRDQILKILEPNQEVKKKLKDKIALHNGKKITAIHVRRGDYLKFPNHHPVPSIEYYKKAIEILNDNTDVFMVFSDDLNWCKENFPNDFLYSDESDEFIDLHFMSRCNNFIIANSSFSWWGSYLSNKNPKIIAPSRWVGKEYANKGWRGIYRKEMNIL
jgi:hypothetical protein